MSARDRDRGSSQRRQDDVSIPIREPSSYSEDELKNLERAHLLDGMLARDFPSADHQPKQPPKVPQTQDPRTPLKPDELKNQQVARTDVTLKTAPLLSRMSDVLPYNLLRPEPLLKKPHPVKDRSQKIEDDLRQELTQEITGTIDQYVLDTHKNQVFLEQLEGLIDDVTTEKPYDYFFPYHYSPTLHHNPAIAYVSKQHELDQEVSEEYDQRRLDDLIDYTQLHTLQSLPQQDSAIYEPIENYEKRVAEPRIAKLKAYSSQDEPYMVSPHKSLKANLRAKLLQKDMTIDKGYLQDNYHHLYHFDPSVHPFPFTEAEVDKVKHKYETLPHPVHRMVVKQDLSEGPIVLPDAEVAPSHIPTRDVVASGANRTRNRYINEALTALENRKRLQEIRQGKRQPHIDLAVGAGKQHYPTYTPFDDTAAADDDDDDDDGVDYQARVRQYQRDKQQRRNILQQGIQPTFAIDNNTWRRVAPSHPLYTLQHRPGGVGRTLFPPLSLHDSETFAKIDRLRKKNKHHVDVQSDDSKYNDPPSVINDQSKTIDYTTWGGDPPTLRSLDDVKETLKRQSNEHLYFLDRMPEVRYVQDGEAYYSAPSNQWIFKNPYTPIDPLDTSPTDHTPTEVPILNLPDPRTSVIVDGKVYRDSSEAFKAGLHHPFSSEDTEKQKQRDIAEQQYILSSKAQDKMVDLLKSNHIAESTETDMASSSPIQTVLNTVTSLFEQSAASPPEEAQTHAVPYSHLTQLDPTSTRLGQRDDNDDDDDDDDDHNDGPSLSEYEAFIRDLVKLDVDPQQKLTPSQRAIEEEATILYHVRERGIPLTHSNFINRSSSYVPLVSNNPYATHKRSIDQQYEALLRKDGDVRLNTLLESHTPLNPQDIDHAIKSEAKRILSLRKEYQERKRKKQEELLFREIFQENESLMPLLDQLWKQWSEQSLVHTDRYDEHGNIKPGWNVNAPKPSPIRIDTSKVEIKINPTTHQPYFQPPPVNERYRDKPEDIADDDHEYYRITPDDDYADLWSADAKRRKKLRPSNLTYKDTVFHDYAWEPHLRDDIPTAKLHPYFKKQIEDAASDKTMENESSQPQSDRPNVIATDLTYLTPEEQIQKLEYQYKFAEIYHNSLMIPFHFRSDEELENHFLTRLKDEVKVTEKEFIWNRIKRIAELQQLNWPVNGGEYAQYPPADDPDFDSTETSVRTRLNEWTMEFEEYTDEEDDELTEALVDFMNERPDDFESHVMEGLDDAETSHFGRLKHHILFYQDWIQSHQMQLLKQLLPGKYIDLNQPWFSQRYLSTFDLEDYSTSPIPTYYPRNESTLDAIQSFYDPDAAIEKYAERLLQEDFETVDKDVPSIIRPVYNMKKSVSTAFADFIDSPFGFFVERYHARLERKTDKRFADMRARVAEDHAAKRTVLDIGFLESVSGKDPYEDSLLYKVFGWTGIPQRVGNFLYRMGWDKDHRRLKKEAEELKKDHPILFTTVDERIEKFFKTGSLKVDGFEGSYYALPDQAGSKSGSGSMMDFFRHRKTTKGVPFLVYGDYLNALQYHFDFVPHYSGSPGYGTTDEIPFFTSLLFGNPYYAPLLLTGGFAAITAASKSGTILSPQLIQDHFTLTYGNARARPWTLLTSAVTHLGWPHLLFNSMAMNSFCKGIGGLSNAYFFKMFILLAIGSSSLSLVITQALYKVLRQPTLIAPAVGASGAITAMVSMNALAQGKDNNKQVGLLFLPIRLPIYTAWKFLVLADAIGLAANCMGYSTKISHSGHLGGYLMGYLVHKYYERKYHKYFKRGTYTAFKNWIEVTQGVYDQRVTSANESE